MRGTGRSASRFRRAEQTRHLKSEDVHGQIVTTGERGVFPDSRTPRLDARSRAADHVENPRAVLVLTAEGNHHIGMVGQRGLERVVLDGPRLIREPDTEHEVFGYLVGEPGTGPPAVLGPAHRGLIQRSILLKPDARLIEHGQMAPARLTGKRQTVGDPVRKAELDVLRDIKIDRGVVAHPVNARVAEHPDFAGRLIGQPQVEPVRGLIHQPDSPEHARPAHIEIEPTERSGRFGLQPPIGRVDAGADVQIRRQRIGQGRRQRHRYQLGKEIVGDSVLGPGLMVEGEAQRAIHADTEGKRGEPVGPIAEVRRYWEFAAGAVIIPAAVSVRTKPERPSRRPGQLVEETLSVLIGRMEHDVERAGGEGVRQQAELGRIVEQRGRRVEWIGHRVADHHTVTGGQPRCGELAGLREGAGREDRDQRQRPYPRLRTASQKLYLPHHPCSSLLLERPSLCERRGLQKGGRPD